MARRPLEPAPTNGQVRKAGRDPTALSELLIVLSPTDCFETELRASLLLFSFAGMAPSSVTVPDSSWQQTVAFRVVRDASPHSGWGFLAVGHATALQFPGTCIAPSAHMLSAGHVRARPDAASGKWDKTTCGIELPRGAAPGTAGWADNGAFSARAQLCSTHLSCNLHVCIAAIPRYARFA